MSASPSRHRRTAALLLQVVIVLGTVVGPTAHYLWMAGGDMFGPSAAHRDDVDAAAAMATGQAAGHTAPRHAAVAIGHSALEDAAHRHRVCDYSDLHATLDKAVETETPARPATVEAQALFSAALITASSTPTGTSARAPPIDTAPFA